MSGALWGGFANAGQTCSGIERVYVMRDVAEPFIEGLVAGATALRVGDPMSWGTEIGPMVSREQFELVRELVDDAVANGAELRCGGPAQPGGAPESDWYAPTVLTGVTHDMRIMREEIFGPGRARDHRGVRGRGDRAGQRLRVRPRRVGVDARPLSTGTGSRAGSSPAWCG